MLILVMRWEETKNKASKRNRDKQGRLGLERRTKEQAQDFQNRTEKVSAL